MIKVGIRWVGGKYCITPINKLPTIIYLPNYIPNYYLPTYLLPTPTYLYYQSIFYLLTLLEA